MELTFEKKGLFYEATFQVNNNFNLHLERKNDGMLTMLQSTVENGNYDIIQKNIPQRKIIDWDFTAAVFPKYIKIISASEVEKVEITEGTSSSAMPEGYTYFTVE